MQLKSVVTRFCNGMKISCYREYLLQPDLHLVMAISHLESEGIFYEYLTSN